MTVRGALIAFSVLLAATAAVFVQGPHDSVGVLATASGMFVVAAGIAAWVAVRPARNGRRR